MQVGDQSCGYPGYVRCRGADKTTTKSTTTYTRGMISNCSSLQLANRKLAIHQSTVIDQLRHSHRSTIGDIRLYFPILSVKWRSSDNGIWGHSHWHWSLCAFAAIGRDGFHVRHL